MHARKLSPPAIRNPGERIGMISNMISETFRARWQAEAIGNLESPGQIQTGMASGVMLSHALMPPLTLHNRADGPDQKRKYYAYVTNQAQSVQVGNEAVMHVQPQELLILRSDAPCQIVTNRTYTTSSLIIDADLFTEYVPNYHGLIARRLSYPFGLRTILQSTLDSCVAISTAGKFAEAGPRIVRSFLELLAVVSQQEPSERPQKLSTSLDIRCAQVKAFIEKNYMSPDLTIGEIARRMQLTPRYVQLAFENEGSTPSEYLRQCRIAACTTQLHDPRHSHRSITDIAFCNGFNSSSHFSTEFKRVHGMSPRAWRNEIMLM
jgi:AraC-like DNA-binding protein